MHVSRLNPLLILGALSLSTAVWAADFKVRTDHEDGIYTPGENVTWTIETVDLADGEAAPESATYQVKSNALGTIDKGTVTLTDGKGSFTTTRDNPGTLMFEVKSGNIKAITGAAFSPEKIEPSLPKPADFDAFWSEKIKLINSIPLNPELTPEATNRDDVELWQVTLDNINGSKVHGQIARPKDAKGKLPALLIVQYAGVYPLSKSWVCSPAESGWLAMNIIAHDLPIYESNEYYSELKNGDLKGYSAFGNDDRETSYFLRMYLSCYQAVRYLKTRPDWDGKILVVRGGSQGGLQTLVTAALCNDVVTAAIANVPAGCDLNGPVTGNSLGWPKWYYATKDKDPEAVRRAAEYYDVVNFCSKIKCPTLIGVGLGDTTCPAPGVYAAANQIQGPVEVIPMPAAGHRSTKLNSHETFRAQERLWLNEIVQGKQPPVESE
ncbi:MAG: acetylxylan esterase [Puniceicoccales bacterium]